MSFTASVSKITLYHKKVQLPESVKPGTTSGGPTSPPTSPKKTRSGSIFSSILGNSPEKDSSKDSATSSALSSKPLSDHTIKDYTCTLSPQTSTTPTPLRTATITPSSLNLTTFEKTDSVTLTFPTNTQCSHVVTEPTIVESLEVTLLNNSNKSKRSRIVIHRSENAISRAMGDGRCESTTRDGKNKGVAIYPLLNDLYEEVGVVELSIGWGPPSNYMNVDKIEGIIAKAREKTDKDDVYGMEDPMEAVRRKMEGNATWIKNFDEKINELSFRSSRRGDTSNTHAPTEHTPASFESAQQNVVNANQTMTTGSKTPLPRPVAFEIEIKKGGEKKKGLLGFGGGASEARGTEAKFLKKRKEEWDKRRKETQTKIARMRETKGQVRAARTIGVGGMPVLQRIKAETKTIIHNNKMKSNVKPTPKSDPKLSDLIAGRVTAQIPKKVRKKDDKKIVPSSGHRATSMSLASPPSAPLNVKDGELKRAKKEARMEEVKLAKVREDSMKAKMEELVLRQKKVAADAKVRSEGNEKRRREEEKKVQTAAEKIREKGLREEEKVKRILAMHEKEKREKATKSLARVRERMEKKANPEPRREPKKEEAAAPPTAPLPTPPLPTPPLPTPITKGGVEVALKPPAPPPQGAAGRAELALMQLSKGDVVEVRSMRQPPASVCLVLSAVCVLCNKKETSWEASRAIMTNPKFIANLREFKVGGVTPIMLRRLGKFTSNEAFEVDKIMKVSRAAANLAQWCLAVQDAAKQNPVSPSKKTELDLVDVKIEIVVGPAEQGGVNFPITKLSFLVSVLEGTGAKVKTSTSTVASKRSVAVWKEGSVAWKGGIDGVKGVEACRSILRKVAAKEVSAYAKPVSPKRKVKTKKKRVEKEEERVEEVVEEEVKKVMKGGVEGVELEEQKASQKAELKKNLAARRKEGVEEVATEVAPTESPPATTPPDPPAPPPPAASDPESEETRMSTRLQEQSKEEEEP